MRALWWCLCVAFYALAGMEHQAPRDTGVVRCECPSQDGHFTLMDYRRVRDESR